MNFPVYDQSLLDTFEVDYSHKNKSEEPILQIDKDSDSFTMKGKTAQKVGVILSLQEKKKEDFLKNFDTNSTIKYFKNKNSNHNEILHSIEEAEKSIGFPFACNIKFNEHTMHSFIIVGKTENNEYICFGQRKIYKKTYNYEEPEIGRFYIDYLSKIQEKYNDYFSGEIKGNTVNYSSI